MSKIIKKPLIIADLDNTTFDWIDYFAPATKASLLKTSEITGVSYEQLCQEYKKVLDREDSIEYPFTIQLLPSVSNHYKKDMSRILSECAEPAREAFKTAAYPYLKPYPNVIKTLQTIKDNYDVKLVTLTDASTQLALWRLHKLGILNYFDGVYGLEDPKIPVIQNQVAVTNEILFKNLDKWRYGFIGKHRALPNDYRKPSTKGLSNILLDFDISSYKKKDIIMIGDNVFRDVQMGIAANITSVWAKYGIEIEPEGLETLKEFVPERFIHKGINLTGQYPKADHIIEDFSEILKLLDR